MHRFRQDERGAAMVEFAFVLPVLLLLVFGIVEFGRAYNVNVQLSGAVREGARVAALGGSVGDAQQAVIEAAPGLGSPTLSAAHISATTCPSGSDGDATVTVSYPLQSLTPLVPSGTITISTTGVMRCGL